LNVIKYGTNSQGEGLKTKNEDGNEEDAIFLQLFKEQEAAGK